MSDGTASSFFSLERERSRLIDSLYKAGTDKKNGGSLQAVRMKAVNRDFRSKIETLLTREQLRRYDLLLDAQKGKLEREKQAGR